MKNSEIRRKELLDVYKNISLVETEKHIIVRPLRQETETLSDLGNEGFKRNL